MGVEGCVYFHYNHFDNTPPRSPAGRTATTSWTDFSTHDPGVTRLVVIEMSDLATAPTRSTRVADSIQQLAPSQTKVIAMAAAASPRLSPLASTDARKLQDGLVAAGFARASYVEIDRQGSVRR